jgi:hypothetical protein
VNTGTGAGFYVITVAKTQNFYAAHVLGGEKTIPPFMIPVRGKITKRNLKPVYNNFLPWFEIRNYRYNILDINT